MEALDARSHQNIIDLLTPLMATEQDRRAFLILTLVNHPLLSQIDFTGPTQTFLPLMVDKLYQFGKLDDGRPALWALLEGAREQVGLDDKHRIDALRPVFDLPPPPRHDRVFRDIRDIRSGDNWDMTIETALQESTHMVLLLSAASMPYRKEVHREWFYFDQVKKPIIPLQVQDCTLHSRMFAYNYIDARTDLADALSKLVIRLKE